MLDYFCVNELGELLALGTHASPEAAETAAAVNGIDVVFLVPGPMASLLLRRLRMFGALEALPGLQWFTHFEWDGKLYLLEELGSRFEAETILASCDDEPVALLDKAQMALWAALLQAHLAPAFASHLDPV
jgi:hypothetical protein